MAHFPSSSRARNLSAFAGSAVAGSSAGPAAGPQAKLFSMFKSQFGSALLRLFCLMAFALCFSGLAHAQTPTVLTIEPLPAAREGNDELFRITLSNPATQRLTFRFAAFSGTGPTAAITAPNGPFDADFPGVITQYTFETNTSEIIARVPTNQDTSYEFDENFRAEIYDARYNGQLANNLVFGDGSTNDGFNGQTVTGFIINDDAPPVITLVQPQPILEGDLNNRQRQNYNFTVDVGSGPGETLGRPITLAFSTQDGTATSQGTDPGQMDFERVTNSIVNVPAGTRQFQFTVVVLGDDIYEDNETFTLRVEFSPTLAGTASSTATGVILENDLPTFQVSQPAPVQEGQPILFRITLIDRNGREVLARSSITFNYSLQDVTTTKGADYTDPTGGTFVIPPNQSAYTLTIPTVDDNIIEQDETFRLVVTSPAGTLAPSPNQNVATGTIDDTGDRNSGTTFTLQDAQVVEGTGGVNSLPFTVSLTKASSQAVSVDYQTLPSIAGDPATRATPGVDYTSTSGRLNFAPNQLTATFSVPIATDSINELDETFRVRLFNPSNANFDNNAEDLIRTGTIIDDDAAGVVNVARADVDVPENVTGGIVNILVNFTPSGPQIRPVTVDFTTLPDTAQQAGQRDYFGKAGRLTFLPGVTQQVIPIEIVDDNIREGDESFTVQLTAVNGASFGPQTATRVTIKDNEAVPLVRIAPSNARYLESSGAQNITISLLTPSQADVVVNYAFVDGTATNGPDYTGTNGALTFKAGGPQSMQVPFAIIDDPIAEGNENFTIQLTNTSNNFNFENGVDKANVEIVDNDRTPELKIGDAEAAEGNMGTLATGVELVFPVTLSRPSSLPVSFVYSTLNLHEPGCTPANGCDSASDDDYAVARNVTVTIAAGQTTGEIRVRIAPDTLNELDEQFTIAARALTNAVPAVYPDPTDGSTRFGTTAFGTIINDDAGGNITIAKPLSPQGKPIVAGIVESYNRGAAIRVGDVANFVVTLPAPAGRAVTVNYAIAGAATNADVEDLTQGPGRGQITFFKGDTKRTISLRAAADNLFEGPESLQVVLSIKDNNGANSYTTNGAVAATTILDASPGVNTVAPTVGFPAFGTTLATRVTINGAQLRTEGNPRIDAVLFNSAEVGRGGIQYLSDNSIVVSVPANAKTGPLRLRLVDGTVVSNIGLSATTPVQPLPDFVVQPVIISFVPTTGVVNASTITITGRNFRDPNNPVSAVQFSGAAVAVGQGATVVSDSRIDVRVPPGATNGPLRIVSSRGGLGPASQASFTVVGATVGSIRLGDNPDTSPIVEGSIGNINQPVLNFNGAGATTFHRPYLFFINAPKQVGGVNNGAALPLTPLTVRFQISSNAGGGKIPQIAVRADLVNAGRPTFLLGRSTNGIVDLALDGRFNSASAIEVAIVDAGTDNLPPIVGGVAANVTVSASIVTSANPAFFPITPAGQETRVQVDRIEIINGNNQTAIAFGPNTRSNFSVPFATNNTTSVAIGDVFDSPPVVSGVRRYTIYRLNVANQNNRIGAAGTDGSDFVAVPDNGRLERGLGYRLVVGDQATVQLKTKGAALVSSDVRSFAFSLTRNVALGATGNNTANATNGYNFIGFPFDPARFQNVDFNEAKVSFNGVDYTVPGAAAAGLINPQLLTLNAQGALAPAGTTIIKPFQAYFVQIFRDNVTLTLQNPTP